MIVVESLLRALISLQARRNFKTGEIVCWVVIEKDQEERTGSL
jgi:hypothetical protein